LASVSPAGDHLVSPARVVGFGSETVINRIEAVLLDAYDEALVAIDQRQAPEDEARALLRDIPYVPVITPAVPAENIHPGYLPSFIQTADEYRFYPLVAIVPDTIMKDPENVMQDQQNVFANAITIHVLSRNDDAIPEDDPLAAMAAQGLVERRVVRMAEAMRLLVRTDARLRMIFGSDADPIMQRIAEPWKFPVEDRRGQDYMFCAVGMEFSVKNYSPPEEV
jgi:hypothetical protein